MRGEGYVKREFDCGHYTLVPGYFADDEECPVCHNGEFVKEGDPTE